MEDLWLALGELDALVVVDHERGAAVCGPGEALAHFAVAVGGEVDFAHELPLDGAAVAAADDGLVGGAWVGFRVGDDAHCAEEAEGLWRGQRTTESRVRLNAFESRDWSGIGETASVGN